VPIVSFVVNEVPRTSNRGGGGSRRHWGVAHREKAKFEGLFLMHFLSEKLPKGLERVQATAQLQFKDRRRRDPDNYHFPISKPLGDALVKGGYLPDDTADFYRLTEVTMNPDPLRTQLRQPARMLITLDYELPMPPGRFGEDCD
jgi:Holliday junction resolvase RusA-like endonuclease